MCERSVNAGTPASPQDGDTSSAGETQEESACTGQALGYGGVPGAPGVGSAALLHPRRARPALPSRPAPAGPGCRRRAAPALGAGSQRPGRGGRSLLTCGGAAPPRSAGLRWAARRPPRLGCARGSAPPGSAPPGGAPGARGGPRGAGWARGGRGAGWRAGAGGGRGSGPPRGRLEAPYLGSDVRGSRRGRTTHFFPFTPQSFLWPGAGTPAPAPREPLLQPGLGLGLSRLRAGRARGRCGAGCGGGRPGGSAPGESPTAAAGGSAPRRRVTGRVTPRAAPPTAPASAPSLSFPPGPLGRAAREAPVAAAAALPLGAPPRPRPGPAGAHRRPQSARCPPRSRVPAPLQEAGASRGGNPL